VLCVGLWQSVDDDSTAAAAAAAGDDGDGGGGDDGGDEEESSEMNATVADEHDTSVKHESVEPPVPESLSSPSGLPLRSVKSSSSEWTDDDMQLDWTQQLTVHQLHLLRDFLVEGMQVNIVEEKVRITRL